MNHVARFDRASAVHPSHRPLGVRTVVGEAIGAYAEEIARLRIEILRDWPFLYENDICREMERLRPYLESWRSVAALVFDGGSLVGASIGAPLADVAAPFRQPFAKAGLDVQRVFYLGGSVVQRAYRGRGLGHRFFDERESHARMLGGFDLTAFCVVDRAADDPRRPPFGRGNEPLWQSRGYRPRQGLRLESNWNERGAGEVAHAMSGWLRPLERVR